MNAFVVLFIEDYDSVGLNGKERILIYYTAAKPKVILALHMKRYSTSIYFNILVSYLDSSVIGTPLILLLGSLLLAHLAVPSNLPIKPISHTSILEAVSNSFTVNQYLQQASQIGNPALLLHFASK